MTIQLFGMDYEVVRVPRADLGGDDAETKPERNELWIADDLCDAQMRRAITHEVLHIAETELDMELTETYVIRLTTELYAIGAKFPWDQEQSES